MKIVEMVGILVVQCERCGQKFVVNTETVNQGFVLGCQCMAQNTMQRWSGLDITIRPPVTAYFDKATQREFNKPYTHNVAMSLEEYKRMLASVILEGKKYKIAMQHKNAISVKVDTADYENLYATLRNLGFGKEESISKVDIAVEQGFVRDTEIIKYILSLN